MLEEIKYTESHLRTFVKSLVYRVLVIASTMGLVLMFGGSNAQAGAVGLVVLTVGWVMYYLHDRVWIMFGWARSNDAKDAKMRSLVKTIAYRLLIMVVAFITFKVIMGVSNMQSTEMAIAQAVTNMFFYYVVERMFNWVQWGKIPVADSTEQPAVTA
jgi:uncharacterized membrane protein